MCIDLHILTFSSICNLRFLKTLLTGELTFSYLQTLYLALKIVCGKVIIGNCGLNCLEIEMHFQAFSYFVFVVPVVIIQVTDTIIQVRPLISLCGAMCAGSWLLFDALNSEENSSFLLTTSVPQGSVLTTSTYNLFQKKEIYEEWARTGVSSYYGLSLSLSMWDLSVFFPLKMTLTVLTCAARSAGSLFG